MNEYEKESRLHELLSVLKDVKHIPVEFLLADAGGKLSGNGHVRVEEHVNNCDECAKVLELAKEYIKAEKEYSDGRLDSNTNIPISQKLSDKLEVYRLLYSKRDKIVEEIAKLLLPEEMWFIIKPVILASKHDFGSSGKANNIQTGQLKAAAFSKGILENKQAFETIEKIIKYTDQICSLLLKSCTNWHDVEDKLIEVMEKSAASLPSKHDKAKIKSCILSIIKTDIET